MPRSAPVDGAHRDCLWEAGEEHGDAGLVRALAGGPQHAANHDVPHRARLHACLVQGGLKHGGEHVVCGAVLERAPLCAADGGAQRGDDDDVVQGAAAALVG